MEETKETVKTADKELTGKILVDLFADVALTEEEIAVFEEIRQDDDSEPVVFE